MGWKKGEKTVASQEQRSKAEYLVPSTANLAGNILVDGCHHGLMAPQVMANNDGAVDWLGHTRLVWSGNVARIQMMKHGNTQVGKGRRKRWARKRSLDYCSSAMYNISAVAT